MRSEWIKKAAAALLAALLLELIPCQFSFWTTVAKKTEDLTARAEILAGYTAIEELDQDVASGAAATPGDQTTEGGSALYLFDGSYLDDAGYLHVPDGSLTLRVKNYKGSLQRIFLNLDFLYNQPVLAEVFARDEGNSYPYSLGDGRILLQSVPENRYLKVYPYGQVSDFYIRIQTADASGNAAAGSYGELVVKYHGLSANGTIPFHFRAGRFVVLWAAVFGMLLLKKDSRLHQISFDAQDARGRQKRFVVVFGFTAILLAGAFFFVRINPACRQNLAVHHAQYQELAEALSEGKVSVGDAEKALLAVKNPYDTIALQAAGIGYRADYAYHDGKYYVYFGIVPVLLLYLPYYLLTGGALQNYVAVFVFFAGFIIAAAGFVYELMKRYFKEQPFYLWAVGTWDARRKLFDVLSVNSTGSLPCADCCVCDVCNRGTLAVSGRAEPSEKSGGAVCVWLFLYGSHGGMSAPVYPVCSTGGCFVLGEGLCKKGAVFKEGLETDSCACCALCADCGRTDGV